MKIYNTLTKQVEDFKPLLSNKVKMYICGPTVYNVPTLGNLRTYINEDLLRRSLKYLGYEVEEVMNITDIEDKIIRDSKAQKIQYTELTAKYEKVFLDNLKALNVESVEHMPHATDSKVIEKMIEIISTLLEKGVAYKSEDGSVYFSIDNYQKYGKLSGLDKREVKAGARVAQDEYDKENAQDFALWKAAKTGEPSWEAPFGKGRPGWHIECTAMSLMNLGETIDIHGGGIDLIFPHHENEIAQSEAYTNKKFVNYWFHTGHLLINGQRMGKSLNNFYTLEDLKEKFNVEPLALRMLSLQSHYRDSLNFTEQSIQAAQNTIDNLRGFITRLNTFDSSENFNNLDKIIIQLKQDFTKAISEDLNIPKALAHIFEFISKVKKEKNISKSDASKIKDLILEFDNVLGLELKDIKAVSGIKILKTDISTRVVTNVEFVDEIFLKYRLAKFNKDFDASDKLREELKENNWIVEDGEELYYLRKHVY